MLENFYFDNFENKSLCQLMDLLCHYTWPILTKNILTTGGQMFTIKRYWTEKEELWEMMTEQSILVSQK